MARSASSGEINATTTSRPASARWSATSVARRNDFRSVDRARTDADSRNTDSNANNNVTWYEYGGERLSKGVDLELFWKPMPSYQAVATFGYLPTAQITSNPSIALVTLPNGTRAPDPNADNMPGMRSPNSPKYTASLWNRYGFNEGWLAGSGVGLGLSYSAEAAINASPLERIYAPGSTLVRLTMDRRFKLGRNALYLNLLLTNLLDEKYYRGRDRGSPRALSLRASYQF